MAIAHDNSSRAKCNNSPSISIVPHTVWTDDELSRTDLRVLLAISAHCRKTDREAWPSQSTIANLLSISRESVSRSVGNLERRGHLRVERVFGDRGEQRSNRYFVPLDGINWSDQSDTPPVSKPSHPPYQDNHTPLSSVDTPPVITVITHNRERLTENVEQESPVVPKTENQMAEAVKVWNEMARANDLPVCMKAVGKRAVSIQARLKEIGLDGWKALVASIPDQPFLVGKVKDFKADIDFVVSPSGFTKILEGKYTTTKKPIDLTQSKPKEIDLLRTARTYIRQMDVFGDKFWDPRWTEYCGLTEAQARLLVSQAEQDQITLALPN